MATNDSTRQSSIGLSNACVYCGRDSDGAYHHYLRGRNVVFVVDEHGESIEWRQDLGARDIYDWLDYIGEQRGWERRRLHETMGDALTAQLE